MLKISLTAYTWVIRLIFNTYINFSYDIYHQYDIYLGLMSIELEGYLDTTNATQVYI